jgi:hypothetical protein
MYSFAFAWPKATIVRVPARPPFIINITCCPRNTVIVIYIKAFDCILRGPQISKIIMNSDLLLDRIGERLACAVLSLKSKPPDANFLNLDLQPLEARYQALAAGRAAAWTARNDPPHNADPKN